MLPHASAFLSFLNAQELISRAVAHEVYVSKAVTVEELAASDKHYRNVHATALFLLTSGALPADETMGFEGIAAGQRDYRVLVKGCAIVTVARDVIYGPDSPLTPDQMPRAHVVLELLADVICANFEDESAVMPAFVRLLNYNGVRLSPASTEAIFNPSPAIKAIM